MRKNWFYKIILGTVFILQTVAVSSQTAIIRGIVKSDGEVLPVATVSAGNRTTVTNYKGEFSVSETRVIIFLPLLMLGIKNLSNLFLLNQVKQNFLKSI